MCYRHLACVLLIHCAVTRGLTSTDWESSPGWERIQTVLPTSETFYMPTAQPRLFTDVKSNEEFAGNHHGVSPSHDRYGKLFSQEEFQSGFPAARFKRQHAVETQIDHQSKRSEQISPEPVGQAMSGENSISNKRYDTPTSIESGENAINRSSIGQSADNGAVNASLDLKQRTFLASPIEKSDKPDDPTTVLSGIYTECLLTLSFTCLQKKIIVLLEKLNKIQKFNILGDYLSVVRNNKYATYRYGNKPSRADEDASNTIIGRVHRDETSELRAMIDESLDNYFETHVIRLKVPAVFQQVTPVTGNRSVADDDDKATHIDFDLSDKFEGKETQIQLSYF